MGPRFLIIGGGSIGERHIRCFAAVTRLQMSLVEPRADRREHITSNYPIEKLYTSLDDVDLSRYVAAAVCTPTNTHVRIATHVAEAGLHIFLEKPISTSLAGVDTLLKLVEERDLVLQVGYVMRSHPGLIQVKEWADAGAIGEILAARVKLGYNVPQYRPDYRDTYWMKARLGGGVLLDATHQLDYIQWLLGEPDEVSCFTARRGEWDVEADVNDLAVLMLRYPNGPLVDMHFNHFQRDYTHDLELIGRTGTIRWSYAGNEAALYSARSREWERRYLELERDDLYQAQAESFAAAVRGDAPPRVTGEEGLRALRLGLAAAQAAETRSIVRLRETRAE